jgi:hypothetical protein
VGGEEMSSDEDGNENDNENENEDLLACEHQKWDYQFQLPYISGPFLDDRVIVSIIVVHV